MAYRIVLTPAAQRQLEHLRGVALVALRGVILARGVALVALRGVILALADEPQPPGAAKLAGGRNLWRLRLRIDGRPWRVVYQLDETDRLVIVTRLARRDEGT